jgi:hypothetical protein
MTDSNTGGAADIGAGVVAASDNDAVARSLNLPKGRGYGSRDLAFEA